MARYIDADKFIKQFERALEHQQKYGLYNHAKLTEYVIKAIENEPTADVAPKSEVAREIFGEIFNIIREYEFDALIANNSYGVFQVRNFGSEILKLKKKYTGEVDGNG